MLLIIFFLLFNKKNELVSPDSGPCRSSVRLLFLLGWNRSWFVKAFAAVHINLVDLGIPHLLWHAMAAEASQASPGTLGGTGEANAACVLAAGPGSLF